ncbi:hypothetical protein [Roseivirga pacifica]|uniref:hypothetical protein n=1 Tax=Roseivirga pacifica TaxID=1267423 RepID=UPI003BAFB4B6
MVYAISISSGLAALLGAVIGGGITIVVNFFQQKSQSKREFVKLAYELAKQDFNTRKELAKPGAKLPPIDYFMIYYMEYLKRVQSSKFKLTDLNKVMSLRDELNEFYKDN